MYQFEEGEFTQQEGVFQTLVFVKNCDVGVSRHPSFNTLIGF